MLKSSQKLIRAREIQIYTLKKQKKKMTKKIDDELNEYKKYQDKAKIQLRNDYQLMQS